MKSKLLTIFTHNLIFWSLTLIFSGIVVKQGILGLFICGSLYGIAMLIAKPFIRFTTLPVKFITIILTSIMIGVMVLFVFNFAVPFIDFKIGFAEGLQNNYFSLPHYSLSMWANIVAGGVSGGVLSGVFLWLNED